MSEADALSKIEGAFGRLQDVVSKKDAQDFDRVVLEDVWIAAKDVEKRLAARGENRALRRIEPFLEGLGHYSKAVEILCNGTPYLPWVWAPVKLFLQIASDHLSAFDKLIKAYAEIGNTLPRFDRLRVALKDKPEFQAVLAVFYCDILDFHRRAYKFFRANGWKRFFDSSWGRFDIRFKGLLGSLRYHADLVDKEAGSQSIASLQEWRETYLEDVRRREKQMLQKQFESVLSWLDVKDYLQEDDVDKLATKSHVGSSGWLFDHSKTGSWLKLGGNSRLLWLNGKPGSGKSVLSAQLICHLRSEKKAAVAFFMCNFRAGQLNTCSNVLRIIAGQLIKQRQDLAGLVYDQYILQGLSPSMRVLKALIPVLISGLDSVRLVIDGLDECMDDEQKEILSAVRTIVDDKHGSSDCKAAIFSRDVAIISKSLKKVPTISLKDEVVAVEASIKAFIHHQVRELRDELDDAPDSEITFGNIERQLVDKADGMFLWVQLVLATLKEVFSVHELEGAVDSLPIGLDQAYGRILDRIRRDQPPGSLQRVTAFLAWIAFAERPLKSHELLDGVALAIPPYLISESTKLSYQELDRCKPLVEVDVTGRVSFVHFTVREYILHTSSGPFLQREHGLYYVAVSCISHMRASLDLVDPTIDEAQRITRIAMGFYGLHRYAAAKWLYHLEQLSDLCGTPEALPGVELSSSLTRLCSRHDRLSKLEPHVNGDCGSDARIYNRLGAFDNVNGILQLASQVHRHEQRLSDMTREEQAGSRSLDDTTLFTKVSTLYETTLRRLLAADSEQQFPYIPERYIKLFKASHENSAFSCRHGSCPYQSTGFRTAVDRDKHEDTHQGRVFCAEPLCPFANSGGFGTTAQLKKHMQLHHSSDRLPIPKFRLTAANPPSPSKHQPEAKNTSTTLADAQKELLLLEQENKKRLLMARQEQDTVIQPKHSISSYWSVPEQNDFVKYISHFGRDFGAIANHMGTKTDTMIKNYYQRQVDGGKLDGGKRPELEKAAIEADERRARGDDLGRAPSPTPIVKRKHDIQNEQAHARAVGRTSSHNSEPRSRDASIGAPPLSGDTFQDFRNDLGHSDSEAIPSASEGPLYQDPGAPVSDAVRMQHQEPSGNRKRAAKDPWAAEIGKTYEQDPEIATFVPVPDQIPVLNDSLEYLDRVKAAFATRPGSYDEFLTAMNDFKSGSVDTVGTMERVCYLLRAERALLRDFNDFLPAGYSITCAESTGYISVWVNNTMVRKLLSGGSVDVQPSMPTADGKPDFRQPDAANGRKSQYYHTPTPALDALADVSSWPNVKASSDTAAANITSESKNPDASSTSEKDMMVVFRECLTHLYRAATANTMRTSDKKIKKVFEAFDTRPTDDRSILCRLRELLEAEPSLISTIRLMLPTGYDISFAPQTRQREITIVTPSGRHNISPYVPERLPEGALGHEDDASPLDFSEQPNTTSEVSNTGTVFSQWRLRDGDVSLPPFQSEHLQDSTSTPLPPLLEQRASSLPVVDEIGELEDVSIEQQSVNYDKQLLRRIGGGPAPPVSTVDQSRFPQPILDGNGTHDKFPGPPLHGIPRYRSDLPEFPTGRDPNSGRASVRASREQTPDWTSNGDTNTETQVTSEQDAHRQRQARFTRMQEIAEWNRQVRPLHARTKKLTPQQQHHENGQQGNRAESGVDRQQHVTSGQANPHLMQQFRQNKTLLAQAEQQQQQQQARADARQNNNAESGDGRQEPNPQYMQQFRQNQGQAMRDRQYKRNGEGNLDRQAHNTPPPTLDDHADISSDPRRQDDANSSRNSGQPYSIFQRYTLDPTTSTTDQIVRLLSRWEDFLMDGPYSEDYKICMEKLRDCKDSESLLECLIDIEVMLPVSPDLIVAMRDAIAVREGIPDSSLDFTGYRIDPPAKKSNPRKPRRASTG